MYQRPRPHLAVLGLFVALPGAILAVLQLRERRRELSSYDHAVTKPRPPVDLPVLALSVDQAAKSLALTEAHFRAHVLLHVRSIKVGRARIVPVIELERWLHLNARFADED